jgi:hypothetical protein
MKHFSPLCIFIFLFSATLLTAQTPTWSDDIAQIVYKNCAVCHHNNGIAPFSLETYTDAQLWASAMVTQVSSKKMPPWPPVADYCHYSNERVMSQADIDKLTNWANGGTPEGNETNAPVVPTFTNGPLLGQPDVKLTIPVHISQAGTTDEYACFIIPTGLTSDKYLRGLQIVPGNTSIVHHVIVSLDTSATMTDCMLGLIGAQTMYSWAAGMSPAVFPDGNGLRLGMRVKAGSNIMLQIHYPTGTIGKADSTSVLLYLYSDSVAASQNPPMRELKEDMYVMNWTFAIPANSTQTITAYWPIIGNTTQDLSVFSIDPHMHLLGRRIVAFAVTPNHDTIPLNKIDDWSYHWQSYYFFKHLVKVPTGSKIYARAFYDNTTNNPENPFSPPQLCLPGEQTTNEMLLVACQYTTYQAGDENFDIEGLINQAIHTGVEEVNPSTEMSFSIFPNPSNGKFLISPTREFKGETEVVVSDVLGKPVMATKIHNLWEPVTIDIGSNANGIYLVQVRNRKNYSSQRIVLGK